MKDSSTSLLPLSEATFYILVSLAAGKKHGYAILKDVAQLSGGGVKLSTSTLYTALVRMQDRQLIERMENGEEEGQNPGLPRKAYGLTAHGRRILELEMTRLRQQVNAGQQRLSWEKP